MLPQAESAPNAGNRVTNVIHRACAIGYLTFGSPSTPLGSRGTLLLLVFGVSALCAETPNTEDGKYHAAAGEKAIEGGTAYVL